MGLQTRKVPLTFDEPSSRQNSTAVTHIVSSIVSTVLR